jgi:putative tricarboxylic transport membrane protein
VILRRGVIFALALSAAVPATAQEPWSELRITAPAAPGGGWDQTARALQQALQAEGLVRTVSVENVTGAAGTIGLARFMGGERGRGDALMVSGLIMLGGVVMHASPITLRDVTPIARLTGEYEVIVVPAASPFRSLDDLLTALRARPESISWGGGSAGGSDQMLAGLVAQAVGVSPRRVNYIAFSGGGESLAAIVGGQVSAGVNGLAELEAQIAAGTVRALAISSGSRLPGLDVPTLREQGVPVEFENWRSVVAPAGLSAEQRARLDTLIARVVRSQSWADLLARYRWIDRYLAGPGFARFAAAEEERARAVLAQFGVAQAPTSASAASIRLYPWLVLVALVVSAVGAWGTRRRSAHVPAAPVRSTAAAGPLAWLGGGLILNVLLVERLGIVLTSALMFWTAAHAFDRTRPWRDAACAALVALAAFLLFDRALGLPLPAGILSGVL